MNREWMWSLVVVGALSSAVGTSAVAAEKEKAGGPATPRMTVSQKPELLLTGDYSEKEVSPKAAGVWWALCPGQDRWARAEVRISRIKNGMVDTGEAMTGRRVETSVCANPVLLARGLQPGSTPVVPAATWSLEADKEAFSGTWKDQPFRIGSEHLPKGGLRLTLQSGDQRQVLFESEWVDDASWSLNWAGDLDGDGRLDLVLQASPKYSIQIHRLFLSTQAGPGKLVREVASFRYTG